MILLAAALTLLAAFLWGAFVVLWWVSPPRDAWDELARRDRHK